MVSWFSGLSGGGVGVLPPQSLRLPGLAGPYPGDRPPLARHAAWGICLHLVFCPAASEAAVETAGVEVRPWGVTPEA